MKKVLAMLLLLVCSPACVRVNVHQPEVQIDTVRLDFDLATATAICMKLWNSSGQRDFGFHLEMSNGKAFDVSCKIGQDRVVEVGIKTTPPRAKEENQ